MDLSDSELYWTRKQKGLVGEEETERYIRNLEKRVEDLKQIEKEHQRQNGELQKELNKSNRTIRKMAEELFYNYYDDLRSIEDIINDFTEKEIILNIKDKNKKQHKIQHFQGRFSRDLFLFFLLYNDLTK